MIWELVGLLYESLSRYWNWVGGLDLSQGGTFVCEISEKDVIEVISGES
jgi:hypothetical protein